MTDYVLMIQGGGDFWEKLTPEQMKTEYQKYFVWSEKLQSDGVMRGGNQLQPTGRILHQNGQGIVDGPYTETKESIGGYFVIAAPSYDEAVAIAKGCPALPHGSTIEVRECVDTSQGS
jgi:hypothetical protein